jgi:hypothetical protein
VSKNESALDLEFQRFSWQQADNNVRCCPFVQEAERFFCEGQTNYAPSEQNVETVA